MVPEDTQAFLLRQSVSEEQARLLFLKNLNQKINQKPLILPSQYQISEQLHDGSRYATWFK